MENIWVYVGIFLDELSKRKLKRLYPTPVDWKEYYDHMTVVYNDDTDLAKAIKSFNDHNIGKTFKLKVVSVGMSDKAFAVYVELPQCIVCANKIAHITLACSPEGNAVDSNYIPNWSNLSEPFEVKGTMKIFWPNLFGVSVTNGKNIEEANVIYSNVNV